MRETDVEVIRSRCAFAMASPNSPESMVGPWGSFCALGQGDGVGQSGLQLSPTLGREHLILGSLTCFPLGCFCLRPTPGLLALTVSLCFLAWGGGGWTPPQEALMGPVLPTLESSVNLSHCFQGEYMEPSLGSVPSLATF